jgi:adenine-specific DNA-methyltransferase
MAKKPTAKKTVAAIKHDEAKRKNIPTAEYQSVLQKEEQTPVRIAYERRNRDLDPQLVWRGKTSRTGPTSSSTPRRSTSRRRCTPRC